MVRRLFREGVIIKCPDCKDKLRIVKNDRNEFKKMWVCDRCQLKWVKIDIDKKRKENNVRESKSDFRIS